jgi:hypothetical protein
MFAIRAAESQRALKVSEFELRQRDAVTKELNEQTNLDQIRPRIQAPRFQQNLALTAGFTPQRSAS